MTQNLKDLPNYIDNRGNIQAVLESCDIKSISIINSKLGAERATHRHLDIHWILITKGEIWIYERPADSEECPKKTVLKVGDLHLTESNVSHTMYFNLDTEFLCFSDQPRDQENYEKNLVRLPVSLKSIYDAAPYQNG